MINKYVTEIYEELRNSKDKVDVLKKYAGHKDLTDTLKLTFHPDIKFHFDHEIDYKAQDFPLELGFLSYTEALRRSYIFIVGHPKASENIQPRQREVLLIQILESMAKSESDIYMKMLLKKCPVKGLNKKIVEKAFPKLLEVQ